MVQEINVDKSVWIVEERKKIEKFKRSRLTEVHRPPAPLGIIARRVSRETDIKDSAKREITDRGRPIEDGGRGMRSASCDARARWRVPRRVRKNGKRATGGRAVDSARSAPGHGRHILLLKRHAGQAVCWLNKELMPR